MASPRELYRRRRGFVYQRLVATRRDERVVWTRPVIIGREMPVVLEFWRTDSKIFHGTSQCVAKAPQEVYTATEREQMMRFAERMGLEFGELDVLRDEGSGLIYVIDANRTSFKPALLSQADFRTAYLRMVPALRLLMDGRAS